jgi:tetratricopeptide (TPR) repeat protein
MRTLVWCAAAMLAASCGKKSNDDKPAPAPAPAPAPTGTAPDKPPAPTKPAAAVPVTSRSPEAVKAFEQGRDLTDNERGAQAIELFKKAIELDPDFAQAHAYLGIVTQGPPGLAELDKAKALAAKLPEAERFVIEGAHAGRSGNHAAMVAAYTKVAELAPGDWRVWVTLGWDAFDSGDHAKAIQQFEKALAVRPDVAFAHDGLAYAHAGKLEWDAAIAAAKKQVELLPKQPNPQDTLGEIYLMAGKFDDAEKAFQAALELDDKYNTAWQGVALARAYRGDWKGAFEANEGQNAGVVDTYGSVGVIVDGAWLALAANNLPDAIARLDVIEKDAEAKKTPAYASAALVRAQILLEAEKFPDAAKWLDTAKKRGDELPDVAKRAFARDFAITALRTAALTKKPAADADKLVAALDDDAKEGDPTTASYAAWAHGLAAWAKGGPKDAVAELAKCRLQLVACRYDLADAQRKGGDTAAADATEKQIRELPQREASAVYYVTDVAKP